MNVRSLSVVSSRVLRAVVASVALAGAVGTQAAGPSAPWGPEVVGGKDHPLVQRFAGSGLVGYRQIEWDQTLLPAGAEIVNEKWKDTVTVEGRITRLMYMSPVGKSPLEVFRNYEQALTAAGFQRKYACEAVCDYRQFFALAETTGYRDSIVWSKGEIPVGNGSTYHIYNTVTSEQGRMLYAVGNKGGQPVHVLLYTSVAGRQTSNMAGTYIQIVEAKAMQTGQVTVDAKALQSGLASDGKVALYGLYFDTGKAVVKPESKPQLEEMAKLLQSQPALKVYIVGHTDNQGAIDANLALSMQRAQAVVAALSTDYKIDAKRLQPRGVANLSPVATNTSDDGRAKNRRVELVVQ